MKCSMVLAASLTVFVGLLTTVRAEDASYTLEQAKRGEAIFNDWGRCYECHLRNLQGDPQRLATALIGENFIRRWSAEPVSALHYKIRYTMPQMYRGAGTLLPKDVSDIVAYILQRNGVPEGSKELPPEEGQLKQLRVKR